jgi:hypothetical protein
VFENPIPNAFANRVSRTGRCLEEEKDCLCGNPGSQQEGAGGDSEHQERTEIVILRLPAQGAFFFHGLAGVLRLSHLLKESSQRSDGQVQNRSSLLVV